LKRVIQRNLQDPLATLLLQGKIAEGGMVKVSAGKSGLTIDGAEFAGASDALSLLDNEAPSHAVH
jgi:ATP-dependent Clp protease ATP-binding subunit ClpB